MKLTQLKALVKQGESEHLEFKSSTGSLTSGMQTVCALLNSQKGGAVIFGVSDNGQIVGQFVTDKTRKDIAAELAKVEPYEDVEVLYLPLTANKFVIILVVGAGNKGPYAYDGRPYMRNQSTTMRMPHEVQSYVHHKNNPTLWENLTNNDCIIKDLDHEKIKQVVRAAILEKRLREDVRSDTVPSLLKKLDLMHDKKLTNAAVVLFCNNERKQFMQSTVQLARFKGVDKKEFLNQKLFRGNAFEIYDKAMDFLTFSLPVAARIQAGSAARVETPAIPYTVLREALINAIVHRDYSHAGSALAVAVYDDRVTITNPGFLPSGVSIKQLSRDHKSIQRNPLIAHVFYLCGKIEKWGRGTLDMIRDCKSAGNPIPTFEEIGGGFSVTLFLREPMRTIVYVQPEKDVQRLSERQKTIIKVLQSGPLKVTQIMAQIEATFTDRTLRLELAKLQAMGLVQPTGKTKATSWSLQSAEFGNNSEIIRK